MIEKAIEYLRNAELKRQKIIVDTSIWIEYFKNADVVEFIERRIMDNIIFLTGPIVSELLLIRVMAMILLF